MDYEHQASTIERPRPGRPLSDDLGGSDLAANHYYALNEDAELLNVRSLNPHLCCVNENVSRGQVIDLWLFVAIGNEAIAFENDLRLFVAIGDQAICF